MVKALIGGKIRLMSLEEFQKALAVQDLTGRAIVILSFIGGVQ